MEGYYIAPNDETTVFQGEYFELVREKHIEKFGEDGANNIRDNIMATYKAAQRQLFDQTQNNNVLLVGKVQSGKTSNLELFTALAFDNGYNLVVIYGGYDQTLLSQTMGRFKNTFNIPDEPDYETTTPVIFSSDDSDQLLSVDDEIVEDLLECNKPIFLISMKRPVAMNKVNTLLSKIDTKNLTAFIIDDEGDQASLNTEKNKKEKASATYASIRKLKDVLQEPLYLSVTATPQALVFQGEYSRLKPDSIRLIEPGSGYCGVDRYHLDENGIIEIVDDSELQDLSNGLMPGSLKTAIHHFFLASAIMLARGEIESDMIIHSHRNVSDHSAIFNMIQAYIDTMKSEVKYNDEEGLKLRKEEFANCYCKLFEPELQEQYSFEELWEQVCGTVIKKVSVILKNSTGKKTQSLIGVRRFKINIYIGGDLLQRGVTFDKLVTTYFLRWPKDSGNMDTNLQRARWLGYREKYIDICKVFTLGGIAREFTNLSEIETDLWEQFYSIQNGDTAIEDILIEADATSMRPTRSNVAAIKTVKFRSSWISQRQGLFDKNVIDANNGVINQFENAHEWSPITNGRRDGGFTGACAEVPGIEVKRMMSAIQGVFEIAPFDKQSLMSTIDDNELIPVITVPYSNRKRSRSFYPDNNKIKELQQGADNTDRSKAVYLGDKQVIYDKARINIQIHNVVPMKEKDKQLEDYTQYMFSVYFPKDKKYYAKGNE